MVVAFDETAQTMQPFTSDTRALKAAIDSVRQTDRKTALKLAYQYVEAQNAYDPSQLRSNKPKPEVWLYSDGRAADADQLSLHAVLKYNPVGSPKSKNVAIVALTPAATSRRPRRCRCSPGWPTTAPTRSPACR